MNRKLPTFIEAESRVKISHFTQQGYDIQGVVHVGANDGEELEFYIKMGIENLVAFEPLPSAYDILKIAYGDKVVCEKSALGNQDGTIELQVTYGDGKGSSIFGVNMEHPEVKANWQQGQDSVVDHIQVPIHKYLSVMRDHFYAKEVASKCDCLVLDTQGNELDVLRGMGAYLKDFKYLNIELSEIPIYDGEHSAKEVIAWLKKHGFTQDSPIQPHNDVFFVRSDIKPESDLVYRGLS